MKDMEQAEHPERTAAQNPSVQPESSASMKFKDYGQLEQAYRCLQAEFTRKCQRLSELERAGRSSTTPSPEQVRRTAGPVSEPGPGRSGVSSGSVGSAPPGSGEGAGEVPPALRDSAGWDDARGEMIRDFLRSVRQTAPFGQRVPGRAVISPAHRPDSFREAGELFLKHLK